MPRSESAIIGLCRREHVARLEGVIDVMLHEAENGTLEQAAASIRASLPNIND